MKIKAGLSNVPDVCYMMMHAFHPTSLNCFPEIEG